MQLAGEWSDSEAGWEVQVSCIHEKGRQDEELGTELAKQV